MIEKMASAGIGEITDAKPSKIEMAKIQVKLSDGKEIEDDVANIDKYRRGVLMS